MSFSQKKQILFFSLSLVLSASYGQDLKQATIAHFQAKHLSFEPGIIKANKIKSIKKYIRYYKTRDDLPESYLEEKHTFRRDGKPKYIYKKPIISSKEEKDYEYDSLGNLIKIFIWKYKGSQYRNTAHYEWVFDTNNFLRVSKVFFLYDNIPVKGGFSYFPAKKFLSRYDSISYDFKTLSVNIASNKGDYCKQSDYDCYPPSFKHPTFIALSFHPNNQLKEKSLKRDTIKTSQKYDECGRLLGSNNKLPKWPKKFFPEAGCINPVLLAQCKDDKVDTVTVNGILMFVCKTSFNFGEHDSRGFISSNGTITRYFNKEFKLIKEEITTTTSRSNDGLGQPSASIISHQQKYYEYFESGLLKSIKEKRYPSQAIEYELTFYE
ncbi:hypothetical protein BKI52_39910 [marine bacterium AO1-C]|nr:hypothetical protein BKI52_39910 [marine bacterium AO1-C]